MSSQIVQSIQPPLGAVNMTFSDSSFMLMREFCGLRNLNYEAGGVIRTLPMLSFLDACSYRNSLRNCVVYMRASHCNALPSNNDTCRKSSGSKVWLHHLLTPDGCDMKEVGFINFLYARHLGVSS